MALEALKELSPEVTPHFSVELLFTTVDEQGYVAAHGLPAALLEQQAAALGYPLRAVTVPRRAPNTVYEAQVGAALSALKGEGVEAAAAGDLFLEDVRRYRQHLIEEAGLQAMFPLWGRSSHELAYAFMARGFSALTVALDTTRLSRAFLGRPFDQAFLEALPEGVDPCGERGEFHTFVKAGPTFKCPVRCRQGAMTGERYAFLSLLPAEAV